MSATAAGRAARPVSPLGRRSVATLQARAREEGQLWLHADCVKARGKREVMAALAKGLGLPAHFGGNLDALYDCLTDLQPPPADSPGVVLVLENLTPTKGFDTDQVEAILEVLTDAADHFREQGIGFRAYYSIATAVSDGSPARPGSN